MPDSTTQDPPTAPVAPQTPPVGSSADAPAIPLPPPGPPENDPNHQMALLIARRGEKKVEKEPEAPDTQAKTPEKEPQKGSEKLGELIADTLKFGRNRPVKSQVKEPETTTEVKTELPPAPPTVPTTISKKKPAPDPIDTARITQQAAAAAASAAVTALAPNFRTQAPALPDPSDDLKPADKHKYEVAQFLAQTNPHYKGAPRVILDQVKRAEQYAVRWETANPGKLFDPNDDEHNDFYESMQEPWSELEFSKAERSMEKAVLKEELKKEYDVELSQIRETNARLELASNVDQKYTAATALLIKGLGDNVDKAIRSGGVDKLEQEDPITATALLETLNHLQPIIETIVQIDDPKGRIKVDMNNPLHQAWSEIVTEGENLCTGIQLKDGRLFATRASYMRMNDAQRSKHWYLTTDNIINGVVDKTAKMLTAHVEKERERMGKIAQSMGFVPKDRSGATNGSVATTDETAPAAAKPTSPSAGAGAKVGDAPNPNKTGKEKLMDAMVKALRG